jgi:hypothetical protein
MPEVATGSEAVAHPLFQRPRVGKAAVDGAVPDGLAVILNTPPVPGMSATSCNSVPKVESSSCAIHAARNSHWHWVQ